MPKSKAYFEPRRIKPEQICLGDLIRVSYPEDDEGLTVAKVGRVSKRNYQGRERVLTTALGGLLLAWTPGVKSPAITLLDRIPDAHLLADNDTLFVFD